MGAAADGGESGGDDGEDFGGEDGDCEFLSRFCRVVVLLCLGEGERWLTDCCSSPRSRFNRPHHRPGVRRRRARSRRSRLRDRLSLI